MKDANCLKKAEYIPGMVPEAKAWQRLLLRTTDRLSLKRVQRPRDSNSNNSLPYKEGHNIIQMKEKNILSQFF